MALARDPFEVTTQQLKEADKKELEAARLNVQNAMERVRHLEQRIAACDLILESYRIHRPANPAAEQSQIIDPYANDAEVVEVLAGLTVDSVAF